ncbi:Probable bifunctional protein acetyl-/propionyl-CoA carboxylase (alpha chain) AccA3 [Mycobacteroides abscessus]|nr:Probable bifunctional protein acetyl-/propionyl-CoA carboxylase (alpha chain) AccA3 [Mycobacteroides abscessus]
MPNHASSKISKVLVANRGEIAVRVIRAAKDAGLGSVAIYADPDADAPHVHLADEAFGIGGNTAAESYLDFGKILEAAEKSGANAIHPGYGFLSENADFAQAVIDAGLIWIGPSPQSIRDLGDKVTARHIAARAQAPLVPGTPDPVKDADEVVAFAKEHGLPIAIKAAFGGGGRGMKVARTLEEVPELFESATREAVAAFGRGECFVERYLDKPRHVEAQVIADQHGNVVVAGTRDCSLQRRFQKLVEEAPAPFLTDAQRKEIHESAKRICKEAGYYGAGTVEYLVGQDGLISFLESTPVCRWNTPSPRRPPASIWCSSSSRSPTARRCSSPKTPSRVATRSSSASTARTPAVTSCRPPARSRCTTPPPVPAYAWIRAFRPDP